MNRFAELLDRLAYEPGRNNKLRLVTGYLRETPDPDRGWALAALTGALSFKHAKAGLIRDLIAARADPVLFEMAYDYVGDLSETVALMWPRGTDVAQSPLPPRSGGEGSGVGGDVDAQHELLTKTISKPNRASSKRSKKDPPTPDPSPPHAAHVGGGEQEDAAPSPALASLGHPLPQGEREKRRGRNDFSPTLTDVVTTLSELPKNELPAQLAAWLDELDETGRWALLKLVTGAMRIGISARLAKTAAAALGGKDAHDVELLWPGLAPPYEELFAWLEGKAEKPINRDPAPFRPVMLAHAIEETDFASLEAADYMAEWKWDGIRVQAVTGRGEDGNLVTRLYSRTGEDITKGFPDLVPALRTPGALDGELLVVRAGRVQSFNVLQQRLNRKSVTPKLMRDFPMHMRAYDLLADGDNDLRALSFAERREKLGDFITRLNDPRVDLSPLVPFATWEELAAARAEPANANAGQDAEAVEGVMLKRKDAAYLPGRPKGQWWKWKRDPHIIDTVLMYAQRGHGKRSSYYSDYTFGVWTANENGEELVPVGKAYFGFTDEELIQIDRFVRRNTIDKFGPVREVTHEADQGLVLEVAFEGLQRSTRHKSGLAMRFPRISRLRWDKPPREADRLETLEKMLKSETVVAGEAVLPLAEE